MLSATKVMGAEPTALKHERWAAQPTWSAFVNGGLARAGDHINAVIRSDTVLLSDSGRRVQIRIKQNRHPRRLTVEGARCQLNDKSNVPCHDVRSGMHKIWRNGNARVCERVTDRIADFPL
jgi:hypothetical protein